MRTDCNNLLSYFSCFGLLVDTSWFKINDGSSPMNAACTIYSNYTQVLGIILTSINSRRGWHGHFFFQDPGLALVAKTCPQQPQVIKKTKNGRAFPYDLFFFQFFFERGDCRYSKAWSHANIRRSDLPMFNIKWNITRKLDATLKPSNYKYLREVHKFSAQKSKCSRRFEEIVKYCTHVLRVHPETWSPRSFFLLFSAEHIWSKEIQTSHIILYLTKTRAKKNPARSGLRQGSWKTFATFHSLT